MTREPRAAFAAGRYLVCDEIAHGGMATVHLGRLRGPAGFTRTVAIKRLHPQFARDTEFVAMFLDEARLASRIHHPNVVQTLDVVAEGSEILLVMEYVHGESLAELLRALAESGQTAPPIIGATIMVGVLHGLHAAHDATDEHGQPLGIVHRDVSPQNILIGEDGIPRVLDFGVAKAAGRAHATRAGQIKGKLAYMAPEQVRGLELTRKTDVFAASIVLWNLLTGRRLFKADNDASVVLEILERPIVPPSRHAPNIPTELDQAVMRGLDRRPERRHESALEMAAAIERAIGVVSQRELAAWVDGLARDRLDARARRIAEIESESSLDASPASGSADHAPTVVEAEPRAAARRWPLAIAALSLLVIGAAAGVFGARIRSPEPARALRSWQAVSLARSAPPPSASVAAPARVQRSAPRPRAPARRAPPPPLYARE